MKKLQQELILIIILLTPLIYLVSNWWTLPQEILLHNEKGEIDSHFSKIWLLGAIIANIILYLIMLVWPKLDPKKRIEDMGNKYFIMRLIFTFNFSVFLTYYLASAINDCPPNNRAIFVFTGIMVTIIGNYIQTVRPNYFLGYRTPWTLESEYVWRKTHRIMGRISMIFGPIIAVIAIFGPEYWIPLSCLIFVGTQVLFLYIYSYVIFQKEKKRAALATVVNENTIN